MSTSSLKIAVNVEKLQNCIEAAIAFVCTKNKGFLFILCFFLALLLRVLCQPLYTYPCFCILSLCSHLYKYIYIYYKGLFHSLNFTSISSSSKINTRNKVKLQKQKSKFTWHIKFILHSLRFRRLYIDFPWHVNIKMSNWSKRFEAWELGL